MQQRLDSSQNEATQLIERGFSSCVPLMYSYLSLSPRLSAWRLRAESHPLPTPKFDPINDALPRLDVSQAHWSSPSIYSISLCMLQPRQPADHAVSYQRPSKIVFMHHQLDQGTPQE